MLEALLLLSLAVLQVESTRLSVMDANTNKMFLGIGLIMARTLATNGAKAVYILGPNQSELDEAVRQSPPLIDLEHNSDDDALPVGYDQLRPILCDITSEASNEAAAAQIQAEQGYLNLLVANAGVGGPSEPAGKLLAMAAKKNPPGSITPSEYASVVSKVPTSDFTKVFEVNATGIFYNILAFLPLLEAGNRVADCSPSATQTHKSHILLTSSIAAITRTTMDFSPSYALSKAALLHLMKNLATYSAQNDWNIRVNAILPGLMKSAITSSLPFMAGMDGKEVWEEGGVPKSVSPMGRLAGEEDIAGAVMWLCSRAGGFVSGVSVVVDGGRTAVVPATY